MTRLGYQIPNFTYPGVGSDGLFDAVARQAAEADQSGFDTVLVMDHSYQLPGLEATDNAMIECDTVLAALAQHTERVRLSALVTGNTYRNPTLLAKTVTALDIVSHGRAQLGIGAGWYELEHQSLGYEFGTLHRPVRAARGRPADHPRHAQGERPSLSGQRDTVHEALNSPAPVGRIPIMTGGAGERKTLRMAAQYPDESNLICALEDIPRKLAALGEHRARLGRDRSQITVTYQTGACIAPTVNMPGNGHVEGRVALLGETLAPLVAR